MKITNTTTLTESQEENIYQLVKQLFEERYTEDYWYLSFEGTRLNIKSFNTECVFEVHSSKGSFNILIELNNNKKGLKRSFKTIVI